MLDEYFGELPAPIAAKGLTASQIDEFGERVRASAAQLAKMQPSGDPIGDLVYPGGWLGNHWQEGIFRAELNCALLYEPRLLVHDPLAEYFFDEFDLLPETILRGREGDVTAGARMWANNGRRVHRGDDLEGIRADLASIFATLGHFESLIRGGVVIMRSQFPTIEREHHALAASVRADLKSERMLAAASSAEGLPLPRWDNLRGYGVTPPGGLLRADDPAQWEPELYYLAKTLMFSRSANALYAPASESELALLQAKSATYLSGKRSFAPSRPVIEEALRTMVPDLRLDPATAVTVRSSEEAFGAWRRELRDLQRASVGVADDDISQLVQDMLRPKVDDVRKAVSKSTVLRQQVPKNMAMAVIAGVGALTGGVGAAAAAAGATGVGGYLLDVFGRRRPDGSKLVIAALLHQS